MAISDSTIGIIGTGTIGSTLAANFAAGGQDFLLAGRDQDAARKVADSLDGHAETVMHLRGLSLASAGSRPSQRRTKGST